MVRAWPLFRQFAHTLPSDTAKRLVPTLRVGMHTRTLCVRVPQRNRRIKNQPCCTMVLKTRCLVERYTLFGIPVFGTRESRRNWRQGILFQAVFQNKSAGCSDSNYGCSRCLQGNQTILVWHALASRRRHIRNWDQSWKLWLPLPLPTNPRLAFRHERAFPESGENSAHARESVEIRRRRTWKRARRAGMAVRLKIRGPGEPRKSKAGTQERNRTCLKNDPPFQGIFITPESSYLINCCRKNGKLAHFLFCVKVQTRRNSKNARKV